MKLLIIIPILILTSTVSYSQRKINYAENVDKHTLINNDDELTIISASYYKDPIVLHEFQLLNENSVPFWYYPYVLVMNPTLIENNFESLCEEHLSKSFIEEKVLNHDYILECKQRNSYLLSNYPYLYSYASAELHYKPDNTKYKIIIVHFSNSLLSQGSYSYENTDPYKTYYSSILVLKYFPSDNKYRVASNADYAKIVKGHSSQFDYNNNLQKLLDSVPSYIRSTKKKNGKRKEKIIKN